MRLLPSLASLATLIPLTLSLSPSANHASSSPAENTSPSTSTSPRLDVNDITPAPVFKNLNLLRNINLEKSYVRESISVVVQNVDKKEQDEYYVPFDNAVFDNLGGFEVRNKDAKKAGKLEVEPIRGSTTSYYLTRLHTPLAPNEKLTLSITYNILRTLRPRPAAIDQDAGQFLSHAFPLYIPTPYTTLTQRTKLRYPSTNVIEYTDLTTAGLKANKHAGADNPSNTPRDPDVQGATHIYGPYDTASLTPGSENPTVKVRYEFTRPVTVATRLERDLEVSHWGANLATEDRYWLLNAGANLTHPFSRVAYTLQAWHNLPSTALSQLVVPLTPAGKGGSGSGSGSGSAGGNPGNAYFIDDVGNVSTSHFRGGGAGKKGNAVLELKPRYPLFGGWKYSFKIGWNAELSAFLRRVASTSSGEGGGAEDTYALKVPLIQPPRNGEGIQVDELVVRVVLPEGAREVRYELVDGAAMPDRKVVEAEIGTAKTFMDTVGRTVLRLRMRNVVDDARGGFLVVTYKYSTLDLLRKPFTFAVGMFAVYAAWWVLGKIDVSIKQR